jgi:hypothetical protein
LHCALDVEVVVEHTAEVGVAEGAAVVRQGHHGERGEHTHEGPALHKGEGREKGREKRGVTVGAGRWTEGRRDLYTEEEGGRPGVSASAAAHTHTYEGGRIKDEEQHRFS